MSRRQPCRMVPERESANTKPPPSKSCHKSRWRSKALPASSSPRLRSTTSSDSPGSMRKAGRPGHGETHLARIDCPRRFREGRAQSRIVLPDRGHAVPQYHLRAPWCGCHVPRPYLAAPRQRHPLVVGVDRPGLLEPTAVRGHRALARRKRSRPVSWRDRCRGAGSAGILPRAGPSPANPADPRGHGWRDPGRGRRCMPGRHRWKQLPERPRIPPEDC